MPEPLIDRNWRTDRNFGIRPFMAIGIAMLLIVIAIVLSLFKGCTQLGSASNGSFFNPSDDGFVHKTNELFVRLLAKSNNNVKATDLESLNKRYPAFQFALPYSSNPQELVEASDIRLVGINTQYLDDDDRDFYFNSRLPQLLRQQSDQMAETFFRIKTKGTKDNVTSNSTHIKPIVIESIVVLPAMFKMQLRKNPWRGTIYGSENCLFNEQNARFLTFGSSMVPVPIEKNFSGIGTQTPSFYAVIGSGTLYTNNFKDINYYDLYQNAFDTSNPARAQHISISLCNDRKSSPESTVTIACTKSKVRIISGNQVRVFLAGQPEKLIKAHISGAQHNDDIVPFVDGMKIVVYNNAGNKLGELTINQHDPTRTLSSLIQTNTGTTRYNIAPSQTDLFTQQMVRGLSRHLTVRDSIDDVSITIDPMLSREFEHEIKDYLQAVRKQLAGTKLKCQYNEQYDISLTVMDLATGDILACPFYTTKFDNPDYPDILRLTTRNVALSRRYLGSTFKPFVAFSAVQANPNLLDLDTHGKYSLDLASSKAQDPLKDSNLQATFFGHRTFAWAKTTPGMWAGTDFVTFLGKSDDVYPVALAAQAMTGSATVDNTLNITGKNSFFGHYRKDRKDLLCFTKERHIDIKTHPFTNWMSYITAGNDQSDYTTDLDMFRNMKGWKNLNDSTLKPFGLEEVTPDITNLHMDEFADGHDFRNYLATWILGQGSNEWSCIAIAQAWSRLISRHDIRASYITAKHEKPLALCRTGEEYPGCNLNYGSRRSPSQIQTTWKSFLDKLQAAQSAPGGTLYMMNNVVQNLSTPYGKLVLFSKTGTPDAYPRYDVPFLGGNNRYFDIGIYTFSLMTEQQYASRLSSQDLSSPPPHGITCVVRITRTYQCDRCNNAMRHGKTQCNACREYKGVHSGTARNFAANPQRLRKLFDMTNRYFR